MGALSPVLLSVLHHREKAAHLGMGRQGKQSILTRSYNFILVLFAIAFPAHYLD